jgi:hypothetical protein
LLFRLSSFMANNINDSDFRVAAVSRRRTFDPDRNFTRLRLNCPVPIGVSAATAPGKSGSPVHEREKVRSRRLYRPPRHCQKRKNGASAEKVSGVAGRIRRHGTGRAVDELVASVKALGECQVCNHQSTAASYHPVTTTRQSLAAQAISTR